MAAAGSAVGLGNVWRFPFVAGRDGGAVFVLIYLFFLAIFGMPLLVAELALGRAAQKSMGEAYRTLSPPRFSRFWGFVGVASIAGGFAILSYYTDIAGWLVKYMCDYARLSPAADPEAAFAALKESNIVRMFFMLTVLGVSLAACFAGVSKGVERVVKPMMAGLLALIAVLAVNSLFLPGAAEGLSYYLKPDWPRFMQNPAKVVFDAMGQAFFTLSIGVGSMTVFGSYTRKDHSLVKEAAIIVAIDTFVAILAGMAIFPACATYGIEYASGPGLVFVALPGVFAKMPGGMFWGFLFFMFFAFAALTTVIAVVESVVAGLADFFKWRRRAAVAAVGALVAALSLPCVFIDGMLDRADFAVSQIWLPGGALALAVFVSSSRAGWGWEAFRAEASAGSGAGMPRFLKPLYAFVIPLLILAIFAAGFA